MRLAPAKKKIAKGKNQYLCAIKGKKENDKKKGNGLCPGWMAAEEGGAASGSGVSEYDV
jgi:uncharacterized protein (UPF0305 family)